MSQQGLYFVECPCSPEKRSDVEVVDGGGSVTYYSVGRRICFALYVCILYLFKYVYVVIEKSTRRYSKLLTEGCGDGIRVKGE